MGFYTPTQGFCTGELATHHILQYLTLHNFNCLGVVVMVPTCVGAVQPLSLSLSLSLSCARLQQEGNGALNGKGS